MSGNYRASYYRESVFNDAETVPVVSCSHVLEMSCQWPSRVGEAAEAGLVSLIRLIRLDLEDGIARDCLDIVDPERWEPMADALNLTWPINGTHSHTSCPSLLLAICFCIIQPMLIRVRGHIYIYIYTIFYRKSYRRTPCLDRTSAMLKLSCDIREIAGLRAKKKLHIKISLSLSLSGMRLNI